MSSTVGSGEAAGFESTLDAGPDAPQLASHPDLAPLTGAQSEVGHVATAETVAQPVVEPAVPMAIDSVVEPAVPSAVESAAEPARPAQRAPKAEQRSDVAPTSLRERFRSGLRWVNALLISLVVIAAFFGNDVHSQDWDPMYMRDIVERTLRYGGSYYENGIHNKGPLEPVVYHLAALLSTYASFWFAISAFILLCSFTIGLVAAKTSRSVSGSRAMGAAVALAVAIHFALSPADYAGVLYSRNMTVTLLAGAFGLLLDEKTWSGKRRLSPSVATVIVGVALGLTMQTLTTAALSVGALGVSSWWLMGSMVRRSEQRRRFLRVAVVGALTFIASPIWYVARGAGDIFWNSWWVYGTYMTRSTNRSLASQLSQGWTQFYAYYRSHWGAFALIVTAASLLWSNRHRWAIRKKVTFAALLGWWLAACMEIVLTQRYSSHYFSVTSVPTSLLAAAVIGHFLAAKPIAVRRSWSTPALTLAIVGSLIFQGPDLFIAGLRTASSFKGFEENLRTRENGAAGPTQTTRAILDLVTADGDPLLTWTNYPWPYLTYRRVSATRFIWKSFLVGEIYLGRNSPEWILPNSWKQWHDDIAESRPKAFILEKNYPLDPGTPAADYVAKQFTTVWQEPDARVDLRNDVASTLLSPVDATAVPWVTGGVPGNSGWAATGDTAVYTQKELPPQADPLFLSGAGTCYRIDGVIPAVNGKRNGLAFRFDDPAGKFERRRLAVEEGAIASGSDAVGFGNTALATPATADLPFTLIVGTKSAVLIAEGRIGAAIRLQGPVLSFVEPRVTGTEVRNLRVSPAGTLGCP